MFNKRIGKIGISMLTLTALTMGGQTVFAASQENIQVAQQGKLSTIGMAAVTFDSSNSEITVAKTIDDEEFIKYIKELITKDTKIIDNTSGKMVNALDADLTKPEILDAVMQALVKEGKIQKADIATAESSKEENKMPRIITAEDERKSIKELITKDTKILDKVSGKMINASDADLTKPEILDAVIQALVKEGKIQEAVAATPAVESK